MDRKELVAAFRNRDPTAIQELVDRHGERLLRSAYLLCGDSTEAEDLVQSTFVEAVRMAPRFRGTSTLYTWLYSILLNLTRRYRRDGKRLVYGDQPENASEAAAEASPAPADFETASSLLRAAVQELSSDHREVLVLRYYEEMKIAEIAIRLDISVGTVKSRLHYAVAELRRRLPVELNLFGAAGTEGVEKP
jgi:RNA polymerase sigma-70 factor, ECF subfamily